MSDLSQYTTIHFDSLPVMPRRWFNRDFNAVLSAWLNSGKTEDEFVALGWKARVEMYETECQARRERGEPDGEEPKGIFL